MQDIFIAIWHHDFDTLQQVSSLKGFLLLLGFILLLESSFVFLPLPGDSLVLFVGGLVGLGILDFYPAAGVLCLAASLGSINAYVQGRYLNKTKLVPFLHRVLPDESLPRAKGLLQRYGFLSLFVSRFIPFVRVLTPMLMGLSKLSVWRTIFISMTSSVTWCLVLLISGKWLMIHPKLSPYQALLSKTLLLVSLMLMLVAIVTLLVRYYASKNVTMVGCEDKGCD
ncbi:MULTISPECIES: DedA family protein [unclassified Agarivorans]|uniref:DedA family protein n=1 Tax=unclassified Agarivorans TaxID=2636026 RepID=UPI0026E2EE10|nr:MULTISPECIES: DedA family protein [unclassified Agarivorans]MDO6688084.1 DedA family protein [Agarivorans sp. 3_MG-2023]MDO6717679.1 DedA family protein [Agarivorans sp. 2_MG-2023]